MPKSASQPVRVAVTGGAGQIAYNLLPRIAHGDIFGADVPVALHILEIPAAVKALEGVAMELLDCAFPLLHEVVIGSDPYELFGDVDYALLVGAKPRGPGMERKDLLSDNGRIFVDQGKALNAGADKDVKVFVVGNPCNTNCLIAMHHAPDIPRKNFHAMTRLDENRAAALLASRTHKPVAGVSNITIWGNHSATQVPDAFNATIDSKPAAQLVGDDDWLLGDFISQVQKRGAAVIAARGKSSAASAASALIDAVKSVVDATPAGLWHSSAVYSAGNSYDIDDALIFSFPIRSLGREGQWLFVDDFEIDERLHSRIKATESELKEERDLVKELI